MKQRNASTVFKLTGLVRCHAGVAVSDVFAKAHSQPELDVWQDYWSGLSNNLFTVLVQDVFIFDVPQQVYTYKDPRFEDSRPLQGKLHPLAAFEPAGLDSEGFLAMQGQT